VLKDNKEEKRVANELNISMIKEHNKRYKETIELPFDVNGKEHIVKIYPYFAPDKIRKCVDARNAFLIKAQKENLVIPEDEIDDITSFFILIHFTSLKFNVKKTAKSVYQDFKDVVNFPLFKIIMKSFPEESIAEIYDRIFDLLEMEGKLENELMKFQDQLKDLPLENRDVLFSKKKQIPEV